MGSEVGRTAERVGGLEECHMVLWTPSLLKSLSGTMEMRRVIVSEVGSGRIEVCCIVPTYENYTGRLKDLRSAIWYY